MELIQYICQQLSHSFHSKTGPSSITVVDGGLQISTADIKKFVTKHQASTFDNYHSCLNTYRHLYMLLSIDDCPEVLSNDKVQKFMVLCHELFSLSGDSILTVSLNQGD